MDYNIPDDWQETPPQGLVVGDGPYTAALAAVLGIEYAPLALLNFQAQPNDRGGHRRMLDQLASVFLVVPEDMQPAEALHCHCQVWSLVEKLSSAGEQHDLAFLFVLPADAPRSYEKSLALGLAIPEITPATTGHAVCRRSSSLSQLRNLAASTTPMDLPPLRARQSRDTRHVALARLRASVQQDDPSAATAAARQVLEAFSEQEYHLDQFCRPPGHPNGNLLRVWLSIAVTKPVTPDWWSVSKQQLTDWLA
jgi:hypothetical protein